MINVFFMRRRLLCRIAQTVAYSSHLIAWFSIFRVLLCNRTTNTSRWLGLFFLNLIDHNSVLCACSCWSRFFPGTHLPNASSMYTGCSCHNLVVGLSRSVFVRVAAENDHGREWIIGNNIGNIITQSSSLFALASPLINLSYLPPYRRFLTRRRSQKTEPTRKQVAPIPETSD